MKQVFSPIQQIAPHESRNPETYGFISTAQMIGAMQSHGWHVVDSKAARVRNESKQGFQKHLVTLEHPELSTLDGLPGHHAGKLRLVVQNSHDGAGAFRMFMGMLRLACMNGIIAGDAVASYRLIHSKRAIEGLHEGVERMVARIPEFAARIKQLSNVQLGHVESQAFIDACYRERLRNVKDLRQVQHYAPIKRREDTAKDAFTLFNRVQETLMRGGIEYTYMKKLDGTAPEQGLNVLATRTTPRLSSISEQLHLNQYAWDKITELAKVG